MEYAIHSAVRSPSNRTVRAGASSHHRLKQFILPTQQRLIRGRPIRINEKDLLRNLPELKKKWMEGILEVRGPDGRVVDLNTLKSVGLPVVDKEQAPFDGSAPKLDYKIGNDMPLFPGGEPMTSSGEKSELPPTIEEQLSVGGESEEPVIPPPQEVEETELEEEPKETPRMPPPPKIEASHHHKSHNKRNR